MDPEHLATLLRLCGLKWVVYDEYTSEPICYCLTQERANVISRHLNLSMGHPDGNYLTKPVREG